MRKEGRVTDTSDVESGTVTLTDVVCRTFSRATHFVCVCRSSGRVSYFSFWGVCRSTYILETWLVVLYV